MCAALCVCICVCVCNMLCFCYPPVIIFISIIITLTLIAFNVTPVGDDLEMTLQFKGGLCFTDVRDHPVLSQNANT